MGRKQFKAESKRLLDLMINSIYTHREIFLRELISNASDALDKLYYKALTEHLSDVSREELGIDLALDKEARLLIIRDNGIGMTKEELENNLGVIARSGSRAFRQDMGKDENGGDVDIIGQFGVGFYSAFMVSDKVTVESRAYGADEAFRWESEGADGYTVDPCDKPDRGTTITLHIKAKTEDEDTDEFLEPKNIPIISAIPSGWTWSAAVSRRAATRSMSPISRTPPSTAWSLSGGKTAARSHPRSTTSSIRKNSTISRIRPG